jgi:hypothetical protein
MKIDQKFIGAKVKSNLLNRYFVIEEGNEELYIKLGLLHIFVNSEPKIKKITDVKTGKKSDINTDSDSNGISDSDSPLLAP